MDEDYKLIITIILLAILGAIVFVIAIQVISLLHDFVDFVFRSKTPRVFKIATPCKELWSEFEGDSKIRFCNLCKKNVHNVCKMSRRERNNLRRRMEEGERVCIYIEPSFIRKAIGFYTLCIVSLCSFIGFSFDQANSKVWDGSAGGAMPISEAQFSDFTNSNSDK